MKDKENLIKEYKNLKKEFIKVKHDQTLHKWKILSRAYKLGKQIQKEKYSINVLCKDFEVPRTTVKRILSLDKANDKTWEKINTEKISSFKAAQVLMSYDTLLQDKIIDKVIKNDLSTYQIKMIRMEDKITFSDTSRKHRNFQKFQSHIKKTNLFLDMNAGAFSSVDLVLLKEQLEDLKYKINKFINFTT